VKEIKFKKLVASLVGVFLFLSLGEIILRIINYPPYPLQQYFILKVCGELLGEYDPVLFWRLKDVRPDFEGADYRIICLSDSVSVMYGGNREYPKMLEELLNAKYPHKKFKVFNAGVPGYSSYQGYLYLKTELINYHPNIVIVNFGPNDHSYAINGVPDKEQKFKVGVLDKILGWSKLYQTYKKLISNLMVKRNNINSGVLRVSGQDFRQNLNAIIKLCKRNHCAVILLTSPYLDRGQSWIALHKKYNKIIREVAEENNIPCLELEDFFKNREDLFIDPLHDHVHVNMAGYKYIARRLFEIVTGILDEYSN
jgi:lysophospholipase L1-like esterase